MGPGICPAFSFESIAMHPSLRMLLLMLLAIIVQFMDLRSLAVAGAILVAMAMYWHVGLLRKIMYRSRWLLLTLLLIYAFTTPGEYLKGWNPDYAPTYEGISQGLLQAGRLAMMLAGLAILLGTTPRHALMAGIFLLLRPLRLIGISPDRFTARLWLTLHYVEQEPPGDHGTFWSRFNRADGRDQATPIEHVRIALPPFTRLDWALLILIGLVAAWWLA